MTTPEELMKVAKMYNVKARVWEVGIPLQKIDRKLYRQIFQDIRTLAVENMLGERPVESGHRSRGGTVDELCCEIERLISGGRCGLTQKLYMVRTMRSHR